MVDTGKNVNKPELLAPAGNYEGFLACINAGCDAVYLGGSRFGARAYADNFTDEEIVSAIRYAHVFGVRVYLTINTLIKEKEFDGAVKYVKPFVEAGLDAFIVQDIGLMKVFSEYFPETQIHVSTQGFCTSSISADYFKELGATRVVLARELGIDEIKKIKAETGIEVETFIHGAMCYSFSGQCLFSSSLGGRSGNRGRCAGPCRHSYIPEFDGKKYDESYVLSMKDQCTLSILPELIDAGIDSLKIEGRMKKPEYAAFVTYIYRKYIDAYYEDRNFSFDPGDIHKLKSIYLRTGVQTGYYNTYNGSEMITMDNPAYAGSDDKLMAEIRAKFIDNQPKKSIDIKFEAHRDKPMLLQLSEGVHMVYEEGETPESAINRETTEYEVIKQLAKLGNTPFTSGEIIADIDPGLFIPVKTINELRRRTVEKLINAF